MSFADHNAVVRTPAAHAARADATAVGFVPLFPDIPVVVVRMPVVQFENERTWIFSVHALGMRATDDLPRRPMVVLRRVAHDSWSNLNSAG